MQHYYTQAAAAIQGGAKPNFEMLSFGKFFWLLAPE